MIWVSLNEIYEVHDVSLAEKDQTVLRKRVKEGAGSEKVQTGAQVKIEIRAVSCLSEVVSSEPRQLSFVAGHGETCDALEAGVLGAKPGEEYLLKVEPTDPCAGPGLDLPTGVEGPVMVKFSVVEAESIKEKWDLSGTERLERARDLKVLAADLFKRGRVRLAGQHYIAMADLFSGLSSFQPEDRAEAAELKRTATLNLAMCLLKLQLWSRVKELCDSVLQEHPDNPKALYRRAKARLQLKEYAEALVDLDRLLALEPRNSEGLQLLREAKRLRKENDQKESNTFAKMCSVLGAMPERSERQGEELFVAPNLDEEYARIAAELGLPQSSQPVGAAAVADVAAR